MACTEAGAGEGLQDPSNRQGVEEHNNNQEEVTQSLSSTGKETGTMLPGFSGADDPLKVPNMGDQQWKEANQNDRQQQATSSEFIQSRPNTRHPIWAEAVRHRRELKENPSLY